MLVPAGAGEEVRRGAQDFPGVRRWKVWARGARHPRALCSPSRSSATATRTSGAPYTARVSSRAHLAEAVKPLLRGYSHAVAAVAAAAGTVVLVTRTAGDVPKQVSLLVYGVSMVVLFGVSALYHMGSWTPPRRALLRRLDHANIFVLIAGTYTPVAVNVLGGAWRIGVLTTLWGAAIGGSLAVAPRLRLARWGLTLVYLLMGWVGLLVLPQVVAAVGAGVLLLAAGGLLYSAGAVVYALRRPRLWPRVFGYHEAFHLLVIAASGLFYAFVIACVIPHPRP
jgi:hemolysin III